jgi:plasmid maintenance system antidote protein VapI
MFLDQTGISNSQFADTCEIPRPTLSQLLNGRNKKVSDEVIGKIHRAYPSLNVMWLMFGDGEMINSGSEQPQAADKMSDSSNGSGGHVDEMGQRAISFDDDDSLGYRTASKPTQRMATPTTVNEAIQSIMRSTAASRPQQRGGGANDRRVVKMLVFYSDGRFEEFGPTQ